VRAVAGSDVDVTSARRRRITLGVIAGVLSSLFGVGGGFVMVPGLTFLGLEQRRANATSLAAVLPISIAASIAYLRKGQVDWTVSFVLLVGGLIGAEVGSRLLERTSTRVLKLLFLAILVAAAVRLMFSIKSGTTVHLTTATGVELGVVGLGIGTLSGLLGLGGGFLMVPAMMLVASMPPTLAKGTSLMAIIPTAAFGTFQNHRRALVDLRTASAVGVAGAIASLIVGFFVTTLTPRLSNALFSVLLIGIAGRTLYELTASSRVSNDHPNPLEGAKHAE
jgi:uncharacterized protein